MKLRTASFALLLFVLAQEPGKGYSQASDVDTPDNIWTLRGYYQNGYVAVTNSFLKGENASMKRIDRFQAFSLQLGWQTAGKEKWHDIWGYPSMGIGVYIPDFYIKDELGLPVAVYGYFIAPFKRWRRFSLNYEISFGGALNWKRYNVETNPYNIAIGSFASIFADWGVSLRFKANPRLDLDVAFTLSHFSNGAMKMPNKGINTLAPRIAARYNFSSTYPEFKAWSIPKYKDHWELQLYAGGGIKQMPVDTSTDINRKSIVGASYGIGVLDIALVRQLSYYVKLGGGLDFAYNGAAYAKPGIENGALVKRPSTFDYKATIAVFGTLEMVFYRLSLVIQPGYYILRKDHPGIPPAFYQRVGLKYHFGNKERWYAGVTVRAYEFQVADFVEWYLGCRISWR